MIAETTLLAQTGAQTQNGTQAGRIDERYAQRHPLQMAVCLRSLMTRRDFLIVHFDGAQIVTQLLDVDSRHARFVFDASSTPGQDDGIANADSLIFRSQPSGIYTEFATARAVKTIFEGRPAFEVSFPTVLYHVQRREYYRVDTPVSEPFIASGRDEAGETFRFDVQDLSLGGVALRSADVSLAMLATGTVWHGVTLQMGGFGTVTADLEVVAPRQTFTPAGERRAVIGCRFVELRGNAERVLQRTITQLETRRLARN